MDHINTLLRRAAGRLARQMFASAFLRGLLPAAAALLFLAIASRILGAWYPALTTGSIALWIGIAMAVASAAVFAVAITSSSRPGDLAVASLLDQRLDLNDRLSTAVALQQRVDPFARAAIEDGIRCARDPKVVERMPRSIKFITPPTWWVGPTGLGLAAAVWFLVPVLAWAPQSDAQTGDIAAAQATSAEVIAEVVSRIEQTPDLASQVATAAGKSDAPTEGQDPGSLSPDDVRRDAMRKLSQMERKLDGVLAGEQAQELSALRDSLSGINAPKEGPGAELAQALKKGDMSAAKKAIEALQKELDSGKMDEGTKEKLAQQLKELSAEVAKAAASTGALERALAEAGLDSKLAGNPQAVEQAIEAANGLNEEQRQSLMKALQAQQGAAGKCNKLSKACAGLGKCAGGKEGKGSGSAGDSQTLSDLETLEQMLQSASTCKNACRGAGAKLAESMSPTSESSCNGQGQKRGRAAGPRLAPEETATGSKMRKEKVEVQDGEVIARQLIEGAPVVGESKRTLERIVGDIARGSEDATDDDPVPPKLQEAHQHYFGEIKRRLEARMRGEGAPAAGKAAGADKAPAADSKPQSPGAGG